MGELALYTYDRVTRQRRIEAVAARVAELEREAAQHVPILRELDEYERLKGEVKRREADCAAASEGASHE